MSDDPQTLLRNLPQVERLLQSPEAVEILDAHPRPEVVRAIRETLDELRAAILADGANGVTADRVEPRAILDAASARAAGRARPWHRRVINATGIILHTGLGRAVLSESARGALEEASAGYAIVEVDPESGERNRRECLVAEILCELTGAESATVVNNNAGATLIILAALARGREVIISRGQLVEIGGSFRIPSVMKESGARLVEVGATNRTYARDYREAIGAETAMLLKVHTSNYEIEGFAHHTPLEELVALRDELKESMDLTVVSDLGSGCFVDVSPYGFRREPLVAESVEAGADVVCFSGDKLLGGPQAGIIVGARDAIERIRAHPLFRALRVDKLTLAALEATLRLYRDPESVRETVPCLRMLTASGAETKRRAESLRRAIARKVEGLDAEVVRSEAQTGSGSLPAQELESWAVAVTSPTRSPDALATALRAADPPVFARVHQDRVLLDARTLLPGEDKLVVAALSRVQKKQ